jgi:phage gp37-like protein
VIITTTENYLITTISELFGYRLRLVDSLPGALNESVIKAIAATTPAVYVAFLGGRLADPVWASNWGFYVATGQGNHKQRRQGEARVLGAYDIIDVLLSYLHKHYVQDVGTLRFDRVQNLFTLPLDKNGVTVYGLTFTLPMPFEEQPGTDTLADFATYHAEHSLVPGDDEPAAIDEITLEQ